MHFGSILKQSLHRLFGVWFVLVFATMALLTAVVVAAVPGESRRRRTARAAARIVFRLTGSWPRLAGLQHLPAGAAVAVANHASYLDGILLTAVLPHNYHFVIKREITRLPVAHFLLRRIGAHFVERHDVQRGASDARRIFQTANRGGSLAIFPEGTFSAEPGLQRFRNGAFVIAARGRLPLVPIAILGTRAMLPADRWLPVPTQLKVVIHPSCWPEDHDQLTAVMAHCRQMILESLDEPDRLTAGIHREPE